MAADFTIGYGDKLPALVVTPTRADNSVVDVAGQSAKFHLDGVAHDADIVLDSGVSKLSYTFPGDDAAGYHNGYFVVAFGGDAANTERFPNNGEILIQVFDTLPGQILTNKTDYQSVRDYLGITSNDLPDGAIESAGFLPVAEAFIIARLAAQSGYNTTVPTVTQIMASTTPATAADKTFLKAAVVYRIAYHFAVGETSAVDTSVSVGPITKDLGGIGTQWKDQREEALKDCDQALGSITGFKRWRTL